MEDFHFITVATHPHKILDLLLRTVSEKNESLTVLGLENKVDIGQDIPGCGRSFRIKLSEVYNFIQSPHLKDNDIVLFSDAYDVFYNGTKEEIIKRYKQMSKPIVFGAEKCCYPDNTKAFLYPNNRLQFPYLNSGLFIGRVYALRECMKDFEESPIVDDQLYWTIKFLETQHLIELDYHHNLFLNCVWCRPQEVTMVDGTAYFQNKTPQLIHGNGPSKDVVEPLFEYLREKYNIAK